MKPYLSFLIVCGMNFLTLSAQTVSSVHPALDRLPSVRDFCMSDAGDEMYFSVQSPMGELSRIGFMTRQADGNWTNPQLLPFSGAYYDLEPFLSPDQKRLYFVSNRPLDGVGAAKDMDIWYVERATPTTPWSAPIRVGAPVNSEANSFYPSVAANGNLYFTAEMPGGTGKDDIWMCRWDGKTYAPPVLLPGKVNTDGLEFNAFISRDEDFLLFTKYNSPGGLGSGDLYMSRRATDGTWGTPVSLGTTINSKFMEYCPFYDAAHQVLYFTSRRNTLNDGNYSDIQSLIDAAGGTSNGQSRLYQVPFRP